MFQSGNGSVDIALCSLSFSIHLGGSYGFACHCRLNTCRWILNVNAKLETIWMNAGSLIHCQFFSMWVSVCLCVCVTNWSSFVFIACHIYPLNTTTVGVASLTVGWTCHRECHWSSILDYLIFPYLYQSYSFKSNVSFFLFFKQLKRLSRSAIRFAIMNHYHMITSLLKNWCIEHVERHRTIMSIIRWQIHWSRSNSMPTGAIFHYDWSGTSIQCSTPI